MINLKVHFTSIKGRRNNNEDAHNIILNSNSQDLLLNDINFFAIYDGHGGDWVSKYLSKNLPKYYCKKDYKYPFSKEYHNEVFNKLQKEILKDKNGQISGSTCLLNLMYKLDNTIVSGSHSVYHNYTWILVKDHPDADKLYVLKIKLGKENKTIVAGIKNNYSKEELIGKKIIVFVNLKPAILRGVKSEGMLLAASEGNNLVVLTTDKDIKSGTKIS